MHLVSAARDIVLSDFADLETKSIFAHASDVVSDFQFFPNCSVFVAANRNLCLEILRIKPNQELRNEISHVRKINIDNLYCAAAAKHNRKHVAFGQANGQVKIYNFAETVTVQRFNDERNSVIFLDYNITDEYVAAVYENGNINIYGTNTNVRIDHFNVDKASVLARFHPCKRCHLCIASNSGAVTLYDLQTRRKLYHTNDFHLAPCRDLCTSVNAPDLLISAGYDCLVNIFDIRRKTQALKIKCSHPLSTVAISECGNYLCAGNLKGELISYDMRHTKTHLSSKKVHDRSVNRLAFVPHCTESSSAGMSFDSVNSRSSKEHKISQEKNALSPKPIRSAQLADKRDSFCDFFLDYQPSVKMVENKNLTTAAASQRNSYDWELLVGKTNKTQQQNSLFSNDINVSANDSLDQHDISSERKRVDDSFVNTRPRRKLKSEQSTALPLREHNGADQTDANTYKLQQIQEEQLTRNQTADTSEQASLNCNDSDKENPANSKSKIEANDKDVNACGEPLASQLQQNVLKSDNIAMEVTQLRSEMLQRFENLESAMKTEMDEMKWSFFTQSFNMWFPQTQTMQQIRDCLNVLLQTDPFVNEFTRLKQENEQLKQQLRKANGLAD